LLQGTKRLIDIVITNTNLHVVFTTFLDKSCKDLQEFWLYQDDIVLSSLLLCEIGTPIPISPKLATKRAAHTRQPFVDQ
ncbi:MAG: hypothetical protein ACI84R_003193, partial [Candidatus Azotimanducaceae bacterium]